MTTPTIEMLLMTNWGYTWDRACELVNDHVSRVAQWKQGGFTNDAIADKLIQLKGENRMIEENTVTVASEPYQGPNSYEEAKAMHEGFNAGLTAYAAAVGHSTLKSDNKTLRELMDKHGWETIEALERLVDETRAKAFADRIRDDECRVSGEKGR